MNLQISDFEKLEHKAMTHYIYKAFLGILASGDASLDGSLESCDYVLSKVKEIYPKYEELDDKQKAKLGNLTCIMCLT